MSNAREPKPVPALALAVLAGVGYFAAARLSYGFAIGGGTVTLWAPAGLTLALLLLHPRGRWLAILTGAAAGSIASDLRSDYRPALALVAAAANIFESLVAARVIGALAREPITLATRRSVLALALGGAAAANAVTAIPGATMLVLAFGMTPLNAWFVWWAGDGLGMLIVTPFLVTASMALRSGELPRLTKRTEAVVLIAIVALVSIVSLGPRFRGELQAEPYVVLPFVFWAAFRIGPLGAASSTMIVAAVATWFAATGVGPFSPLGRSEWVAALEVYLFLAVTSVSGLIAAAALAEWRTADAQLRASEERYRRAQKLEAIGKLAGGIAHDFNNILTVIQGHCDLLKETLPNTGDAAEDLAQIRDASGRAAALTQQLLAFSRRQALAPGEVSLHDVLGSIAPMLRRLIGSQIAIEIPENRASPILADLSQIEQVIVNLAVNARDAMPGGGTVTFAIQDVRLSTAEASRLELPAGDYVRLDVTDTGTGIEPGAMQHLFEPFFTTKREGEGTGLGLATVHGIVKQTNGAIDVVSEVGRGTTFSVYLPRLMADRTGHADRR